MKPLVVFCSLLAVCIQLLSTSAKAQVSESGCVKLSAAVELYCMLKMYEWDYFYCDRSVQPPLMEFRTGCSLSHTDFYQQQNSYEIEFADANNVFQLTPYFPVKLAIGKVASTGRSFLEELQLRSNCSTFDENAALACINDAVNQLNTICPQTQNGLGRKIDIVDASQNPHGFINLSTDHQRFTNPPGGTTVLALAETWSSYSASTTPLPKAYISARVDMDGDGSADDNPNIYFNFSADFKSKHLEWSTDCPCNTICDERGDQCKSFCRTALHELTHLFQIGHIKPGCPLDYDRFDIMTTGSLQGESVVMNRSYPGYDSRWCDNTLSSNDKCYICKRICVNEACSIVDNIEMLDLYTPQYITVTVVPNPAQEYFTMHIVSQRMNGFIEGMLLTVAGHKILEIPRTDLLNGEATITLDIKKVGLAYGSYLVVLSDGYDTIFKRIIVQK